MAKLTADDALATTNDVGAVAAVAERCAARLHLVVAVLLLLNCCCFLECPTPKTPRYRWMDAVAVDTAAEPSAKADAADVGGEFVNVAVAAVVWTWSCCRYWQQCSNGVANGDGVVVVGDGAVLDDGYATTTTMLLTTSQKRDGDAAYSCCPMCCQSVCAWSCSWT